MSYDKKADVTSLDSDLTELRRSKFSKESIKEIENWIYEIILKEPLPSSNNEDGESDLLDKLKDGTVLCRVANVLYKADSNDHDDCHIKWRISKMPFVQMEQISQFLSFARQYGVPEDELFQTVDLFEKKDPASVYQTLKSITRYANRKQPDKFPVLGPQLTVKKPRPPIKKKPDHLKEGQTGWSTHEYGYMNGASQKTEGVVFGQRRNIL
ncbi:Scp1p NDAI_0A08810 [Naumovozyma dairenensis CBS 421]|uniref:Calponin-homology (CH) domain-containing protein n=1 Tax=Naumovozyma dairenensis (strain ATCC 10597 / BCRC 20456 / CBS 421 / NBRC 0211 / NRRL Y-12639) TaxID=1071378 RepID=G0W5E5_NAUDC|nr:hypothetical protein NDAI_0A08810 [Naumovozyma dairenensis CBS 421]CCD23033.1 hypothetical protein NDAI_0A08810 [Naumovozyma dairenensis CBS 421]